MPLSEADQSSWTFRLKHHKTTILLFVRPLQSFDSIKEDLLHALRSTRPDGTLNGNKIPTSSDEVVLGVPIDNNDLSKGWVALEIPESEILDEQGVKRKVGGKQSVLNQSPQGAGLKDGAVLAFKFREPGAGKTKDEDKDDLGLEDEQDDGQWDVSIPSYEEEYGSQADYSEE
ncbi:hypothetical protein L228DRAFT_245376 [Xylona heveae TC161]|uniref:Uncharacterized protein n=1 Tax=Xylona heveae (strain CBS 132557 / TC161) TaxID=1328760 RepID=A0A165I695_XYLHT|nr:hypothetical protein L228DRAFT_245376 [Xylona heveae TC161]KZF24445.1 hypothetical protein L228DRAFT_245376 [Xylona heveae TC161]